MSRKRTLDDGGIEPEMNVTPLVDVVLVLLIIFMVVAPHLEQDVPVNLPGIFNPDPEVDATADPLKVSIAKAGEYHLEGKPLTLAETVDRLQEIHVAEPDRRLVIRADAKLPYGAIRELMGKVQLLGFPGLNFMVGEKHRDGMPGPSTPAAPAGTPADGAAAPGGATTQTPPADGAAPPAPAAGAS